MALYDTFSSEFEVDALRVMMMSMNNAHTPVTTLYWQPTAFPVKQDDENDEEPQVLSKRYLDSAPKFFELFTTIHMRLGSPPQLFDFLNPHITADRVSSTTYSVISALLQFAQGLQHLSFGFADKYYHRECILHFPLFQRLKQKCYWPKLRSLELENMCLVADEFIDFIKDHTDTLEEVTLIDIVLTSGEDWQKVVNSLENASLNRCLITTPLTISSKRHGDSLHFSEDPKTIWNESSQRLGIPLLKRSIVESRGKSSCKLVPLLKKSIRTVSSTD